MDQFENILDTGGRYLSPADRQFVGTLLGELEQFQHSAPKDRALMFHPLGGFQRYLIHKVTQVFPRLTSFSIGDERNRRTVVCFKGRKRDQLALQGLAAPRNAEFPRNDYVNSPQRSMDLEASRRNTPTNRSRESSRNRKKHEQPEHSLNKAPRTKSETGSHVPRPLRSKKVATKREQMRRSRSLQSSPLRGEEREPCDEGEYRSRGRSRSQSGKQPRSASLKARNSSKKRDISPNFSEDDRKLRKPPIRANVSDTSLKRRGDGLRVEGKVINGDIEDPYSCGDSESDANRVDAEAIRREKRRHDNLKRQEYESTDQSSDVSESEESSDDDISSHHSDEQYYENIADDVPPPTNDSLKRSASLKKARRNLNRVKQASARSEDESAEQKSSANGVTAPKRSSAKKSSTLPSSTKEKKSSSGKKSQTLKSTSSAVLPPEDRRVHAVKKDSHKKPAAPVKERVKDDLKADVVDSKPLAGSQATSAKPPIIASNRRDSGTQTEITGTLPRKVPDSGSSEPSQTTSSQAKSMGEMLAAMMQSLGVQSQSNPSYPQFNPAFHQASPPQSIPSLPPNLVHTLYMSWLGAYYAGATGTWPPPAPPSFILPSTSNPSANPSVPIDFLNPSNFPFPRTADQEADKHSENTHGADHSAFPSSDHPGTYPCHVPGEVAPAGKVLSKDPLDLDRAPSDERRREGSPTSSHGRYGSSLVLTDTDTSSAVGSNGREVAIATNMKSGVMVYVRSQPNSRASSVGASQDGLDNDPVAPSNDFKENDVKITTRDVKKRKSSASKKRSGDQIGEPVIVNMHHNVDDQPPHASRACDQPPHLTPTHEQPARNHTLHATPTHDQPLHASSAGEQTSKAIPVNDEPPRSRSRQPPSHSSTTFHVDGSLPDPALDASVDADASQEEIILSLRRAPLATIEDDADGSLASSSASLHSDGLPSSDRNSHRSEEIKSQPDDFPPPPSTDPNYDIPPIDQSITDTSSADSESHLSHNGTRSSATSSISEGNQEAHPSDSSYDADQSRVDEASHKLGHNDVVVQDPEFNYYNWNPEDTEWEDPKYKRFVEIYNFPPKLSDIEISRYLTKFRGLRLSRIDQTTALCTLPSEEVADELMKENFPIFNTRPIPKASEKSRKKAKNKLRDAEFEAGRATRPKTDPSVAKRIIAASLGNNKNGAKEKNFNQ